jgi:DNA-directed RNA polymerase specialized sigma24 family protein
MPGSAADAGDVLQETWLRRAGVDLGTVHDQRAYLVRITTRQALSRLRGGGHPLLAGVVLRVTHHEHLVPLIVNTVVAAPLRAPATPS